MISFVVKSAFTVGFGTETRHLGKSTISTKPIQKRRIMGQVGHRRDGVLKNEMATNARVAAFHLQNTKKSTDLTYMYIISNRGTNLMITKSETN